MVGTAPNYIIAVGNNVGSTQITFNNETGQTNNAAYTVAIGTSAGQSGQSTNAVAIGAFAGQSGQGSNSIAIGYGAGSSLMGDGAIIIGCTGATGSAPANSIQIGQGCQIAGATGRLAFGCNMEALATTYTNGSTIAPIGLIAGFIPIQWNGTLYKIPVYNA